MSDDSAEDQHFDVMRASGELRLRVTEDLELSRRRVEVLDSNDKVVGDLTKSVIGATWKMGVGGIGVLTIEIAVERAVIESIEVPGLNAPRQRR